MTMKPLANRRHAAVCSCTEEPWLPACAQEGRWLGQLFSQQMCLAPDLTRKLHPAAAVPCSHPGGPSKALLHWALGLVDTMLGPQPWGWWGLLPRVSKSRERTGEEVTRCNRSGKA